MNTSWHSLIGDSESHLDGHELQSGEWFTIRFTPDLIAGEVFNIGVVFIDQYKDSHYRLIENANAFSCLFGDIGLANINFLLRVVNDELKSNNYTLTPSPHIIYSTRQTAQGDCVEDILDDLFKTMVSLVCKNEELSLILEDKPATLSTNTLRGKVFGRMKKDYEALYNKIHSKEPYEIMDPYSKKKMLIDMPIRHYTGLEKQKRQDYYGSVVSAAYLNEVHRIHHINYIGVTNVMNCCEMLGRDVRTALIIYLPPTDKIKFTDAVHLQAENELDRCLYSLYQMEKDGYQIKIEVKESPEECLDEIIEFVS